MNRRTFLKLLGLTATAATAGVPFAWKTASAASKTVTYLGRAYRSDGSGKIYVSLDNGRSWKTQINLGSSNSVTKLSVDNANQLRAAIAFSRWSYGLVLGADQTSWLTA